MAEIARQVSVSPATVSYVLSGGPRARVSAETRGIVLEAAARLGYSRNGLAVALRSGRTNMVGIVCPVPISSLNEMRNNWYVKDSLAALTLACAHHGYAALACFSTKDKGFNPQELAERRVDGVITINGYLAPEWIREVSATSLPLVEFGTGYGPHQIHAANYEGARTAMRHLYELGHRRIAYLGGSMGVLSGIERFRGYDSFCVEHNLQPTVCRYDEGLEELLRHPYRPTAIFTYDDQLAWAALKLAKEVGLSVPKDLSIVGFNDDIRSEMMVPSLTTVAMPLDGIAEAAVSTLTAVIADRDLPPKTIQVPTYLVVRNSTGPVPAGP